MLSLVLRDVLMLGWDLAAVQQLPVTILCLLTQGREMIFCRFPLLLDRLQRLFIQVLRQRPYLPHLMLRLVVNCRSRLVMH